MKTELDIGLGLDDFFEVFIPKDNSPPYECNHHIKVSNLDGTPLLLHIYEGVCIENKNNHLMRTFELENARNGIFLIQMKLIEKENELYVRIMSDDIILDDLKCCVEPAEWLEKNGKEDDEKREWIKARDNFIEFVDNSTQLLQDEDVKKNMAELLVTTEDIIFFNDMIQRIKDAQKINELSLTISKDEYEMMLEEISGVVNPVVSKLQMIIKREKL